MKESIQHLFVYIILFIIIFLPDTLFAENITMTAVGEYVMGDNDTYTEAKKLALQDAKRILLEKVGTYIESKTEVKDGVVKSDEIKQYTAGIVKVEEVSDERSVLANKASVVKVKVKAVVDPDALIKQVISFRNRKDVEESAKKMSADNYKLRKEIEQLSQQLRSVADEKKYQQLSTQRKEILEQIDSNEKGLTLLLSGESLYTAALLDRQRKDEMKRKVKIFVKELASAYKLSSSAFGVNDNGDNTANVTFTVKAEIAGIKFASSKYRDPRGYHTTNEISYEVQEIAGVNLAEFLSTGFQIVVDAHYYKKIPYNYLRVVWPVRVVWPGERDQEIKKFLYSEQLKLFLIVELGKIKDKIYLTWSNNSIDSTTYYNFEKEYNIRMTLSELKSLSKLKLKVLYDSQEYGQ